MGAWFGAPPAHADDDPIVISAVETDDWGFAQVAQVVATYRIQLLGELDDLG